MIGMYLSTLDTAEKKDKFEALYYEYRDIMYNFAFRILNDSYLAEDAVHNAFLKLLKNLDKIKELKSKETKTYLLIIVRNTSYNIWKKNCKETFTEYIDDISDENDLPAYVEAKADRKHVYDLIVSMDSAYSDVLMLKMYYECSNEEIARIMDISANNVGVRLYRAKKILSKMLKEEYSDE